MSGGGLPESEEGGQGPTENQKDLEKKANLSALFIEEKMSCLSMIHFIIINLRNLALYLLHLTEETP